MADSEKTQTDKDVAREEIDHTVVMEDGPKATSGNRSGTHLSDVIDNAPAAIDRVDNRFMWIKEPEIKAEHEVSYYFRNKNILVTTSGNMSKLAFECTRKAIGIDSIIFASDYPYESLADMMKFMDSLDLSPEDQEKVFHLNAEKYLL